MMWKPGALQCLSPAPTKKTWLEMKANMEGGHKLHEAKQDRSAYSNKGFSGNSEVSYRVFYGLILCIFLSLPIFYPSLRHQPSVLQWSYVQAATSSASMGLTWWDVSNPLISKNIHIQEEKIMGANITGAKLSPKLPEEKVIPKTCEADKYEVAGTLRTQRPLTSILGKIKAGWKWDPKVHKLGSTMYVYQYKHNI